MKTMASALLAVAFTSLAAVSTAQASTQTMTQTGFTTVDHATSVCKYVKKADRKRDLNCIH